MLNEENKAALTAAVIVTAQKFVNWGTVTGWAEPFFSEINCGMTIGFNIPARLENSAPLVLAGAWKPPPPSYRYSEKLHHKKTLAAWFPLDKLLRCADEFKALSMDLEPEEVSTERMRHWVFFVETLAAQEIETTIAKYFTKEAV